MALVPIISQTWDTTSVFTPTRMNTIEQNLAIVSKATGVEYSSGVSVKDKIDSMENLKVVKTINANTYSSWALAIQSLYNDYLLLSPKEQLNCVVRRATQVVYRLSNQTAKFTTFYTTPYSQVSLQEMDLQNETFIDFTVSASGTTRTDLSSNTQNQVLELIVV